MDSYESLIVESTATPDFDLSQISIDETVTTESVLDRKTSFDVIYEAVEAEKQQKSIKQTTTTTKKQTEIESDAEPVEYFVQAKESLRHVTDTKETKDNDFNENDEQYIKIPVQQLINTFEKQMRSIIKQQINEKIQVKLDDNVNENKLASIFINKEQFGLDEKKSFQTESPKETVPPAVANDVFSIKINDTVNALDSLRQLDFSDSYKTELESYDLINNLSNLANDRLNESAKLNSRDDSQINVDTDLDRSSGGKITVQTMFFLIILFSHIWLVESCLPYVRYSILLFVK